MRFSRLSSWSAIWSTFCFWLPTLSALATRCGGQQTADRDGGRDRSMKKDAPGPHAGDSLPIITNLCRNRRLAARTGDYSHSIVPGGFEVMS